MDGPVRTLARSIANLLCDTGKRLVDGEIVPN